MRAVEIETIIYNEYNLVGFYTHQYPSKENKEVAL
jgi:hypothetical protein